MKNKVSKRILMVILLILIVVAILWITKVIPRFIAKQVAIKYTKNINMELNFKEIEYSDATGYWMTCFEDWDGNNYYIGVTSKYLPTKVEFDETSYINIISDLPVEKAVEDGCFVITENKIYNKDKLDSFIENTGINSKNRIEDSIRIVVYNHNNEPIIYDLEYRIYDEKYTIGNEEVNKTGYILRTDASRVNSWDNSMKYQESIETHQININDDIPGEFYGINLIEDKDRNVAKITLSLYAIIDYVSEETVPYEEIEIASYSLDVDM